MASVIKRAIEEGEALKIGRIQGEKYKERMKERE